MQSTNYTFKFVIRTYGDNMFYCLLHILLLSTTYDLDTLASGMIYDSEMKRSEVKRNLHKVLAITDTSFIVTYHILQIQLICIKNKINTISFINNPLTKIHLVKTK